MAISALSPHTLGRCAPGAGAPQCSARREPRNACSSPWAEFERKDTFQFVGARNCNDRQWRAASRDCRVKNWRHGQCRCSGQQFLPDETKPSISRRPSATTPRSLLSPAKTYLEAELTSEDKFWVIAASTPEELLAAATLRAQIFYSYPQVDMTLAGIEAVGARVANDLIIDDLLRTRRKSEFTRESKFEALGMRVKCLLAVCRQSSVESIGGGVATSCLLAPPPVPSIDSSSTGALVAIGTLDVQVRHIPSPGLVKLRSRAVREAMCPEWPHCRVHHELTSLCIRK